MIYIVDDDAAVSKAMARLMKSAHLTAQTFASGEEFLASARPTSSDCVVLDVQMPGMTGLQVQEQLVRSDAGVPVIFITAFDDDEARETARRAGAVGYFRKPFDDQALLDAIAFATGQRRAPGCKC